MAGDELHIDMDRDSRATLRAYAAEEGISEEYAAAILLTREVNRIAADSLDPRRPSRGRIVEG